MLNPRRKLNGLSVTRGMVVALSFCAVGLQSCSEESGPSPARSPGVSEQESTAPAVFRTDPAHVDVDSALFVQSYRQRQLLAARGLAEYGFEIDYAEEFGNFWNMPIDHWVGYLASAKFVSAQVTLMEFWAGPLLGGEPSVIVEVIAPEALSEVSGVLGECFVISGQAVSGPKDLSDKSSVWTLRVDATRAAPYSPDGYKCDPDPRRHRAFVIGEGYKQLQRELRQKHPGEWSTPEYDKKFAALAERYSVTDEQVAECAQAVHLYKVTNEWIEPDLDPK